MISLVSYESNRNALSYKLDPSHHILSLAFKQALRTAENLSSQKQIGGSNDVRTKCQTHKLTMIKQIWQTLKKPERQDKTKNLKKQNKTKTPQKTKTKTNKRRIQKQKNQKTKTTENKITNTPFNDPRRRRICTLTLSLKRLV